MWPRFIFQRSRIIRIFQGGGQHAVRGHDAAAAEASSMATSAATAAGGAGGAHAATAARPEFCVLVHGVAKKQNIGNMLRSACAFGVAQVLVK